MKKNNNQRNSSLQPEKTANNNTKKTNELDANNNINNTKDNYVNDPLIKQRLVIVENSEEENEYKRLKNSTAVKQKLDKDEILDSFSVEVFPKSLPIDYSMSFLSGKYFPSDKPSTKINDLMTKICSSITENITKDLKNEVLNINIERKNVSDIIGKQIFKPDNIIKQKMTEELLYDLKNNQKELINKKKVLNEEKTLLLKQEKLLKGNVTTINNTINKENLLEERNNSNEKLNSNTLLLSTAGLDPNEIVEHNIRKNRIKEINKIVEHLDEKMKGIELRIQEIIDSEDKLDKKQILKSFIENFEKDVQKAEEITKQNEKDYIRRMKFIQEKQLEAEKIPLIRKENEMRKELEEREKLVRKGKEFYDKVKEKNVVKFEKLHIKIKENAVDEKISHKNYLFSKLEENDILQKKNKEQFYKEKIKQIHKEKNVPISKEEIEKFSKKVKEEREKLCYDNEKKRLLLLEDLMNKNANLPKVESETYKKFIAEKTIQKEMEEKAKLDKAYRNLKIQNFGKLILEKLPPIVDEKKKKEIEDRVKMIKDKDYKKHKKANIKRPTMLKLNKKSRSLSNKDKKTLIVETNEANFNTKTRSISPSNKGNPNIKITKPKIPLLKNPDYLREIINKKNETEGKFLYLY